MSSTEHVVEPAGQSPSIGRITPLNMTSDTGRLSYDSLIGDMTTANDYDCAAECMGDCGQLWA